MNIAEAGRRIGQGVLEALNYVRDGRTMAEEVTARRITEGTILPIDRYEYIRQKTATAAALHLGSGATESLVFGQPFVTTDVHAYKQAVARLERLSVDELDRLIQDDALAQMERWGLLCRWPRVDQTTPVSTPIFP